MSERFHVGTKKGLFRFEREGDRWRTGPPAFPGVPVSAVRALPGGDVVLAALDHGHFGCKLQRSEDGGRTFAEIAAPSWPPRPEGIEDVEPFRRKPIPWSLQLAWSLDVSADGAEVWCGTIPGGLFRSRDRGDSWELIRPLWDHPSRAKWFGGGYDFPGIHSVLVHPRDRDRLLVGVSCGGVWRSEDGGASWAVSSRGMRATYMPVEQAEDEEIQDPHRIARCHAHPERVWAQHHNGIFRSDDEGRTWTGIEDVRPSNFGFAVAAHPIDPEVAWFVPAEKDECRIPTDGRLVVLRTRDGGRSFTALSRGLPAGPAYDLVYRHALDVDATGERLVFGSTTGALWTSDDGGDAFRLETAHLPPVLAVAFT